MLLRDDFRSLIPALTGDERSYLLDSLIAEGNRDPIIIWREIILDGHNRYDICRQYDIPLKEPIEIGIDIPDAAAAQSWIIRNQIGRRNLIPYQRSVLALKLEDLYRARAKESYQANVGRPEKSLETLPTISHVNTRDQLADLAHVSGRTLDKVKVLEEKAGPDVKAKLASGEVSINRAYNDIRRTEAASMPPIRIDPPVGKYRTTGIDNI